MCRMLPRDIVFTRTTGVVFAGRNVDDVAYSEVTEAVVASRGEPTTQPNERVFIFFRLLAAGGRRALGPGKR